MTPKKAFIGESVKSPYRNVQICSTARQAGPNFRGDSSGSPRHTRILNHKRRAGTGSEMKTGINLGKIDQNTLVFPYH